MDVTRLLIALFVGMAVLIFLIMKTRLHPSLSLVISACVVGIVGGVELASIPGLITSGFGNTLAGIGLVIAFGCMMGQALLCRHRRRGHRQLFADPEMLRIRRHGLGGDLPPRILGQDP